MGIRVECDWCREAIRAGTPYITIEVDGKLRRAGEDVAVSRPASVYCGGYDGCAERLLGLLDGNPAGRLDMGLEWKLAPIAQAKNPGVAVVVAPKPPVNGSDLVTYAGHQITRGLYDFIMARPSSANQRALPRGGVLSLEQADEMADEELLALTGVGRGLLDGLRAWIREIDYDGRRLMDEVNQLLQDRLGHIAEDDPHRDTLSAMLTSTAPAEEVAA